MTKEELEGFIRELGGVLREAEPTQVLVVIENEAGTQTVGTQDMPEVRELLTRVMFAMTGPTREETIQ